MKWAAKASTTFPAQSRAQLDECKTLVAAAKHLSHREWLKFIESRKQSLLENQWTLVELICEYAMKVASGPDCGSFGDAVGTLMTDLGLKFAASGDPAE
jgi:hypothetical protein